MILKDLQDYWDMVELGKPHLVGEGMVMTHQFLEKPTIQHNEIAQYNPKPVKSEFRRMGHQPSLVYLNVDIGQAFFVKTTADNTTLDLANSLINALNTFNKANGSNHIYESHRDSKTVTMLRVG